MSFSNSLNDAFRMEIRQLRWTFRKMLKNTKSERSSLYLSRYHSGRRRTKHAKKNFYLLQEKLINDPRISARKNGLEISIRVHLTESLSANWNDILIWCMYKKKEQIINAVDLLKENQDLLKRVIAGMRRRMQVCLQRNWGHIEGNWN